MPPSTDCPTYPPCTLAANNTTAKATLLKSIVSVDSSEVTIFGEKNEILVSYDRQEFVVNESNKEGSGTTHIIHYFTPTEESKKILDAYSGKEVRVQLTSVINSSNNEYKTEVISLKLRLQ